MFTVLIKLTQQVIVMDFLNDDVYSFSSLVRKKRRSGVMHCDYLKVNMISKISTFSLKCRLMGEGWGDQRGS